MDPPLLSLLLLACTGVEKSGPAEPGPPPTPPLPVLAAPVSTVLGAWSSPSCGARTWTRALRLDEGGSFMGRDLVSPCPPGTTCVWSGVVERQGAWKAIPQGALLEAGTQTPVTAPGDGTFPSRVQLEGAELVDDYGCRYQQVPTLP